MRRSDFLLASVLALLLLAPLAVSAQALFTFTPDDPPVGDGLDYPRSLNPARQIPDGVAPGQFDSGRGVFFQNTNGNPAFFDGNNLLTRPSSLITNEAFWTDPKLGSFESNGFLFDISSMGFQFVPAAGEDFGFDLAIASVSTAVPTSLPVFIQNTAGAFATIELALTVGGPGDILPDQADTFSSLNSPFPGREARFRIAHSELAAILGGPAPVLIFTLEMEDLSTLGGTTQLAVDNFVIAGAEVLPNEVQREPVRFQSELLPPGELLFFLLDPATSQQTGLIVDVGMLGLENVIELAARTTTPPGSALPEIESTLTIPVDSALRGEPSVRLGAPSDGPPPGISPFVTAVAGVEVGAEVPPPSPSRYYLEASRLMHYEQSVRQILQLTDLQALADAQNTRRAEITAIMAASVSAVRALGLPAAGMVSASPGSKARAPVESFDLYINYTLDEYLAERASLELQPVVGDTGGAYTPVFDDQADHVDYLLQTWIIADEPGVFAQVLFVPEPEAAAMLSAAMLTLSAVGSGRSGRRGGSNRRA